VIGSGACFDRGAQLGVEPHRDHLSGC
jgi:hypothetical protein